MAAPAARRKAPRKNRVDPTRPPKQLISTCRYYRVDRRDIGLLRFILEAYEGVATLTTVRPQDGVVMVRMAPGHEDLVTELLEVLGANRDLRIEPLADSVPTTRENA